MRQLILLCVALAAACSDGAVSPTPEPPVDHGHMRVQISGAVRDSGDWQAFGQFRDLLASDTGEVSLMKGQTLNLAATAESSFTLVVPARLGLGQLPMVRYVPGTTPPGAAAFVILDSTLYASIPGGTLVVDSAGYPARPGLALGGLRGTLTFKAVRLVAGPGGVPLETSDTITVHASFNAHWYHYIYPNVSVTLSGAGPVVGTSQWSTAQVVDDDHGGKFVEWESDFGAVHTFPHAISQELRIAAPSVGTFTLPATTPAQFEHPAAWPAIYTALFYRDDPRLGLSTGGALTITQYLAPTDEFYGEIDGTLTSPLALWVNDSTLSGDTANVTVRFAVQLWPLGGIPASISVR